MGIVVERHGSTVLVTMDRPGALNALSAEMVATLPVTLREAARDRSCRAIVVTGAGERAFCAGIDVKGVAARDEAAGGGTDPIVEQFENLHGGLSDIVRTIHVLPVPVIAAVNGHAIGAGFAMAAACDLRIGSDRAAFADGFVKRGISGAEMGLSYFLPRLVPPATAFEWMLTGRRVEATEAQRCGLLGEITTPGELVDRALALASTLADNAPMALAMTKEVMWANLHAGSLDQALALESRTQVMTRNTADAREARQAFLDKRSPVFETSAGTRAVRGA